MCNKEIRNAIRVNDLTQWQIADKLGVSENTINRWLRHELPSEKKKAVLDAIKKCKAETNKE